MAAERETPMMSQCLGGSDLSHGENRHRRQEKRKRGGFTVAVPEWESGWSIPLGFEKNVLTQTSVHIHMTVDTHKHILSTLLSPATQTL